MQGKCFSCSFSLTEENNKRALSSTQSWMDLRLRVQHLPKVEAAGSVIQEFLGDMCIKAHPGIQPSEIPVLIIFEASSVPLENCLSTKKVNAAGGGAASSSTPISEWKALLQVIKELVAARPALVAALIIQALHVPKGKSLSALSPARAVICG